MSKMSTAYSDDRRATQNEEVGAPLRDENRREVKMCSQSHSWHLALNEEL